ncbi:N-acetyltransferase [Ignisphaera sp. 4213-co]|uniref:N-alpha-acetyltransferase n=1 Tax=Ignisphaera cupida TaxID=3050454 RepID=A0ABD4Z4A3_9CREN|nr:N-acetyltransferase [Ignisphaera sp. 4213-co]MDK6028034.1 N-acetyltransferase [Ignisphaera sp. 4213-co]
MNSDMRIKIRPATDKDIDYVIAINIECLPEHYPLSFWLEHLSKYGDVFYVAEVDDKIVGYVLTRVEEGESLFHIGKKVKKGHIVSVAVRENYRRRGIATYLLSTVLSILVHLYEASEAYLEVRVSNVPAIKLYEKLGFEILRKIEGYYLDGEDAYLMAKRLK